MPAADEVLVHLVARRIEDAGGERGQTRPRARREQRAEDRVLRQVRALAQERVPGAEPGAQAGIDENVKMTAAHTTTGSHSESAREAGIAAMIGSPPTARGKGTRCKSGTVPPL